MVTLIRVTAVCWGFCGYVDKGSSSMLRFLWFRSFQESEERPYSSSVWGPTCDGLDCILEDCPLPELRVGQWLFFRDMGAYTMSAASTFNGMPPPQKYYYCEQTQWSVLGTCNNVALPIFSF